MDPKEQPVARHRRRSKRREREEARKRETIPVRLTRVAKWVVGLMLLLVLLLGSFLLGRHTAPSGEAKAAAAEVREAYPRASAVGLDLAGKAIDAIAGGNLERALSHLERIEEIEPELPGWRLARARVLFGLNRKAEALRTVNDMIRIGNDPASALILRAAADTGDEPITTLQQAISAAPFAPEPFLAMGRALRARGRPREAAPYFQKALFLMKDPEAGYPIRLEFGLALVEADDSRFLKEILPAALTESPVPSQALFAGAANAMRTGRIEEAATLLGQARTRTPPELYAFLMRDPIWNLYRDRPELRDLWNLEQAQSAKPVSQPPNE